MGRFRASYSLKGVIAVNPIRYSRGAAEPAPAVYAAMVHRASRRSRAALNTAKAFCIGGGICLLGELLGTWLRHMGLPREEAGTWVSVILVFCSAMLTGLGLYEKLAKHGGAGTLVPITGFANAVSSAAVEARTEGLITGVGTKIFTIAGPVILYGTAASALYGLICWLAAGH